MAAALGLGATAPLPAQPSSKPPGPGGQTDLDGQVRSAMGKAVAFLYSRRAKDGQFPNAHSREYAGGGEALAVLALLWSGESPEDKRLAPTLRYLASLRPGQTYTRSLRAMVYSLLEGEDARRQLGQDVAWLLKHQQRNGGWGYGPGSAMTRIVPEWTDASNSQLAALALREAADAGQRTPAAAWRQTEAFWKSFQNADGGWGYQPPGGRRPPQRPESHGSMTTAGVAPYFILAEMLPTQRELAGGSDRYVLPFADRITRGLRWLEQNFDVQRVPKYVWMPQPSQQLYYLWCLARVGDASGAEAMGKQDYARQIARWLCSAQRADGSWGDSVVDTSLGLLCLGEVSAPVVIARADLGEDPAPEPRDAARVARWLARRLRRPLAWRHVAFDAEISPRRCGLLYLNPSRSDALPEDLLRKAVRFIRFGGTCLVQAEDAKAAARLAEVFARLMPECSVRKLPDNHPALAGRFTIDPQHRPALTVLGDEERAKLFVLGEDAAGAWHRGLWVEQPDLFGLAGNLVLYANGGKLPPGRLVQPPADEQAAPPARRQLRLARLKYPGDFDARPGAIRRLSGALRRSLSTGLKELPPADGDRPIDRQVHVLLLTGTVPPALSQRQRAHLLEYLSEGGTLLILPASKRQDFGRAAAELLQALFGEGRLATAAADSPLLTGRFAGGIGGDATAVRGPGGVALPVPKLRQVTVKGRIAAVLCPDGAAADIDGADGPAGRQARLLALNAILYAATYGQTPPGGQWLD